MLRPRRDTIMVTFIGVLALFGLPCIAQDGQHPAGKHKSSVVEETPAHDTGTQELSLAPENLSPPGEDWPKPVMNLKFGAVILEQFEYRFNEGTDTIVWDAQGWYGGDYNRFWVKTEGEVETRGTSGGPANSPMEDPSTGAGEVDMGKEAGGDAELQLLYSRMIAPFWDVQAGIRIDQVWGSGPDPSRVLAVIGFQGLAPYRFEVEPTLFISEAGGVSARLTATMDVLLTQKLILQPRAEVEIASRREEKFGVGQGLEYVELGLRLRYEIKREFAPYIGINWLREFGETADISNSEGNRDNTFSALAGVRLRF